MSMQLYCEYSEVELTFVDALDLTQTQWAEAYFFMCWPDDGKEKTPDKTNQQIFDSYCKYICENYLYLTVPKLYSTDRDEPNGLPLGVLEPAECKTLYYKTSYDFFLERANEFFDKHGGIDNVFIGRISPDFSRFHNLKV